MPVESETNNNQNADDAKRHSNKRAKASRRLLRLHSGRQPPLAQEIPDARAEMKRRSEDSYDKKGQVPRILHVFRNVRIRRSAMREPALRVKMPANVRKRDDARVSLRRVEPIPYPRIRRDIGFAAQPNVNAIAAVKKHGKKNSSPFHNQAERNGLQFLRSCVVFLRAYECGAVGPEMLRQKCPNGKDAGKRMQLSEEITRVRLGCRRRHALSAAHVPAGSR